MGIKARTLVLSALGGGDCIDDDATLRRAATVSVLGQAARAPSALWDLLQPPTLGGCSLAGSALKPAVSEEAKLNL
jgi:hypothetical protein